MVYFVAKVVPFVAKGGPVLMAKGGILPVAEIGILYLYLTIHKLEADEISKEEYDRWRYRYPEFDTTNIWAKVPPKEISDWLTEAFKPGK